MEPNIDTLLIRCSAIGKIMTEPKAAADKAAGKLGQTCLSYLHELYLSAKYERLKEYSNKYIQKGKAVEEDAITLLTVITKKMFKKNTERLTDEFLTGEPDVYIGEDIRKATEGYDTKASYDLFTFPGPDDKLPKDYEYQNHGYMALTGAQRWTTAYCLVNATPELIISEKRKIYYDMNCPDDTNEEYIRRCIEVEKNMIFDMSLFKKHNPGYDLDCREWRYDIPKEERIRMFTVERDQQIINKIYVQVYKCRQEMKAKFQNVILPPAQTAQKKSIVKRA